jgi:hypothetical protein
MENAAPFSDGNFSKQDFMNRLREIRLMNLWDGRSLARGLNQGQRLWFMARIRRVPYAAEALHFKSRALKPRAGCRR